MSVECKKWFNIVKSRDKGKFPMRTMDEKRQWHKICHHLWAWLSLFLQHERWVRQCCWSLFNITTLNVINSLPRKCFWHFYGQPFSSFAAEANLYYTFCVSEKINLYCVRDIVYCITVLSSAFKSKFYHFQMFGYKKLRTLKLCKI